MPCRDTAKKQFATAAGVDRINWDQGLVTDGKNHGATYARIVQDVLAQNGVPSEAKFNYPSSLALADDIIAKDVPVIASVITAERGTTIYKHAVLIQWDKDSQQFLVNNINTEGTTVPYTQTAFESGKLRVDAYKTGAKTTTYVNIDFRNTVIFARNP